MPLYTNDSKSNDSQMAMDGIHCLRQVLTALGVYHAPWIITFSQTGEHQVRLDCYWNPNNTFPKGKQVDLEPTHVVQDSELPISNICDVNFIGLARALAKRMSRKTVVTK